MRLLPLALASLRNRAAVALLTLLAIAASVFLLVTVEKLREGARSSFVTTISGTDLIVGAPTSDIALLLYSVFHIGEPTGGIGWATYEAIEKRRGVDWAVPVALGDGHRGRRIVGTTADYFEHIRTGRERPLTFARGRAFEEGREVVLGSEVAETFGYELARTVVASHGLGEVDFGQRHAGEPFTVVGILEPTGTPIDRSLLAPISAMSAIHGGGARPEQVTAVFLGLRSRIATLAIQRALSRPGAEPVSAVLPGVAFARLWSVVGQVERTLLAISWLVVAVACIGLAVAILASLEGRRREIAILRGVGAAPADVVALLVFEAMVITLGGLALGVLAAYAMLFGASGWLGTAIGVPFAPGSPGLRELFYLAIVALGGLVAGLVPAWRAYRTSLADGLISRG